MSLPAAVQDKSAHPASNALIDPVNVAEKNADVDRKLRLYGVVQALRDGRFPDNAQIDETLQYVLDHSPVDLHKLSPDGKKLIEDIRDIIETARLIVAEKNPDELAQNFFWHTRDTDLKSANPLVNEDGSKKDASEILPVDKEKANSDGQEAVKHLRTILSLVLTNSEVRKIAGDFQLIGRDLLARGATKAAQGIAPDQEALSRVDESAPQDQFITEGGRVAGPNETPVLETRIPGTDKHVAQHPKDDLGTGARVKNEDGTETSGARAYEQGQQQFAEQKDHLQREADQQKGQMRSEAEQARYDHEHGQLGNDNRDNVAGEAHRTAGAAKDAALAAKNDDPDAEVKKQGLMDRIRGARDGLAERIPQSHKDQASDKVDRGKQFLKDEFPEERRDQFIYRMKKVIIECQKHDDYQESLRWLLSYVEEYVNHAQVVAAHGKESHSTLKSDPALNTAIAELRTLLERFANGQSSEPIIQAANMLIDDARRDPELKQWFKDVDTYIRKVLLDVGFVLEPACNNEAKALRESGREFYDGKYKGHFDNLFNTISTFFKAMGDDPLNKKLGEDFARLTKDLLFDSEGSLKFKSELWRDIRRTIVPTLIDKVGYIPIPRIEYTDDSLDLVIENLTLSGRNLFPNFVSVEAHNYAKFSPYDALKDEPSHHEFSFTLGQIQADLRDVAFYFKKKSGFPKLSDSGLADIFLGGEGLTATVHLVSSGKDKSSVFKVKNVVVKVDTLKFSIRDSKHDFLYKTVKPLATGLVKKQIQKAVADAITTGLEFVDGQLVGVRDKMSEAKINEGETRAQALQDLFKRKKDDAQSVTASKASGSTFKVVANKRNSVLSTGHPAGWVNRAAEKEDAAHKGNDWRSEAFHIVRK